MSSVRERFGFYELRTIDLGAAQRFYQAVLGPRWRIEDCGQGEKSLQLGEVSIGKMTHLPPQAIAHGAPSHWLGHVCVEQVETALPDWLAAGSIQLGPARRLEDGVTVAPLRDPLGAVMAISDRQPLAPGLPWHELHSKDEARALSVYGQLLGWQPTDAFDPGLGIGPYQQFAWSAPGPSVGGMVSSARLPGVHAHWLFYFQVPSLDEALAQVVQLGGHVYHGPRRMPGGALLGQSEDPQRAVFGLFQTE